MNLTGNQKAFSGDWDRFRGGLCCCAVASGALRQGYFSSRVGRVTSAAKAASAISAHHIGLRLCQRTSARRREHQRSDSVEIHADACCSGDRVLLVDDLVATGGTMLAAACLIRKLGAEIVEAAALVDLPELGGSSLIRAAGIDVYTAFDFAGH